MLVLQLTLIARRLSSSNGVKPSLVAEEEDDDETDTVLWDCDTTAEATDEAP